MREVSANEQLSFARRQRLIRRFEVDFHLRETLEENVFNVLVPAGKFAEHVMRQLGHFLFRQRHDSGNNAARDVVGGGAKRTQ